MSTAALDRRASRAREQAYTALAPDDRLRALLGSFVRHDTVDTAALIDTMDLAFTARVINALMLAVATSDELMAAFWIARMIDGSARVLRHTADAIRSDPALAIHAKIGTDELLEMTATMMRNAPAARIARARAWWDVYARKCDVLGVSPDELMAFGYNAAHAAIIELRKRDDWTTITPADEDIAEANAILGTIVPD